MNLGRIFWCLLVYSHQLRVPLSIRGCASQLLLDNFKDNFVLSGRSPKCVAAAALWYAFVLMTEHPPVSSWFKWSLFCGVSEDCIQKACKIIALAEKRRQEKAWRKFIGA